MRRLSRGGMAAIVSIAMTFSLCMLCWAPTAHAQQGEAKASAPSTARPTGASSNTQQADAALVSRIAAQLAQHAVVQSAYTQTQTRAALRRPLISGGHVLFTRDSGVVWTVERPVQAVYVITERGVRQIPTAHADGAASGVPGAGQPASPAPSKAPPAAAAEVTRMMRAMLAGDLSALYSQFDVDAQGTATRWRLRLVPNQPQIAQAVRQVDLEGSDFVTSLEIVQANGDTLQWTFDDAHALPSVPAREKAWLAAP